MRLRWEQTVRQDNMAIEEVVELEDEELVHTRNGSPVVMENDVPVRVVLLEFVRLVQALREATDENNQCQEDSE